MIATNIYKLLDKLVGKEYLEPKQMLIYGLRAYQATMQWEVGEYKDSYFLQYLRKLEEKKTNEN